MNELLRNELLKDEEILWEGQPSPWITFTSSDIFLIPFSLLWGGFAIFWEVTAFLSGAPIFFLVFGSAFVVMGLYFIFGRFIYKRMRKGKTYYAVTNKRVISIIDSFNKSMNAEYIDRVPSINKTVRPDGIGTLTFGNAPMGTAIYANSGMDFFTGNYSRNIMAFYDIEDVDRVYGMINDIRKS